jgi:nucleotide-binding universal stress UspA family protein
MEKKILIPVEESRRSLRAVRYAVHAASFIPDLHFVLFHVQPMISLYLQDEAKKDLKVRAELNKVKKKNQAKAMALLENYREEMTGKGVDKERIELKTQVRHLGLAQDIIEYAQENLFDSVLMGRRQLASIQKMFSFSVTSSVLERSQVIPVWLVDGVPASKTLLIAVDGSASALRAVDHAGFMVSGNPDIQVTLLHVMNSAQNYCTIDPDASDPESSGETAFDKIVETGDRACIDQFYPLALKKFEQMGISREQVRLETVKGSRRIGNTIVSYAKEKGFDTLVIGRTGMDRAFFMGSASRQVINHAGESALWIVS